MADFKVDLIGYTMAPQLLSAAGALGCFEEKSSAQLMEELMALPEEERLKKEKAVLKNSFGKGHGSVGDQNCFIFSIEDLPRTATFQLCLPEYLAHLQQSLRRAKASRGFYLPEAIRCSELATKANEVLAHSFELYESMCRDGIPGEDARFILPLYTKTNIQTAGNARELCHLWKMSQHKRVPSIVRAVVDEMIAQAKEKAPYLFEDFGSNYETLAWFPSAQLYSDGNMMMNDLIFSNELRGYGLKEDVSLIDSSSILSVVTWSGMIERAIRERNEAELANLKHLHFEFLVSMSLACLHQAIRQRTWDHTLEPIYNAVQEGRMVVPPTIMKSDFLWPYKEQHRKMLALYRELVDIGVPESEAIGVIPHSLKIYTLIHVNGWNAIHSIGKRTCLTAQWEIRRIAQKMAKLISDKDPLLGKWTKPQCVTYGGSCPEDKKDCPYDKKKKTSASVEPLV